MLNDVPYLGKCLSSYIENQEKARGKKRFTLLFLGLPLKERTLDNTVHVLFKRNQSGITPAFQVCLARGREDLDTIVSEKIKEHIDLIHILYNCLWFCAMGIERRRRKQVRGPVVLTAARHNLIAERYVKKGDTVRAIGHVSSTFASYNSAVRTTTSDIMVGSAWQTGCINAHVAPTCYPHGSGQLLYFIV